MIESLRPSTLGEILDRTADMYRSRFLVFLGIASLPAGVVFASAVVVFLFFAWMGAQGRSVDPTVGGVVALLFLSGCGVILAPLCAGVAALGAGALNHAAVAAFHRQRMGIREAYKAAWKRGWRYIGIFLIEGLIIFVAPGIAGSLLIGIAGVSASMMGGSDPAGNVFGILMVLLLLGLTVYGVWMLLMLCLAFAASAAENAPAWTAVKRAIFLSKGTRGRILVLYVLGIVLRWSFSILLTTVFVIIVMAIPHMNSPQHASLLGTITLFVVYGGSFAVRAFTKPVYTIAQLLFYYDQRVRKEGFDIEWMMLQAGMMETPTPALQAAPWLPSVARPGPESAPPAKAPAVPEPVVGETTAALQDQHEIPSEVENLQPGEPV